MPSQKVGLGWVPGGSRCLLRRYDWIPIGSKNSPNVLVIRDVKPRAGQVVETDPMLNRNRCDSGRDLGQQGQAWTSLKKKPQGIQV